MPAELKPVATTSPAARKWGSVFGYWRQARPPQPFAAVVGAGLILVSLAHLAAWLLVGGAWAGPVSFRKPTTFGVSFGLTTITRDLGRRAPADLRSERLAAAGSLAAADTYEVVWVWVQRWRGVASHFNFDTALDTRLFLLGRAAIAVTANRNRSSGR